MLIEGLSRGGATPTKELGSSGRRGADLGAHGGWAGGVGAIAGEGSPVFGNGVGTTGDQGGGMLG